MGATFNGSLSTTMVFYYSSINNSDESGITTFVRYILKYNVVIIKGIMNAQKRKGENYELC